MHVRNIGIGLAALVGFLGMTGTAHATVMDTLYFTTYNAVYDSAAGNYYKVWKTTTNYSGDGTAGNGTFNPGTAVGIAYTPGADGLVLNPNNGQLLVGGQGAAIYQVDKSTGTYTTLSAGSNFEITVDPSGNTVYGGDSEGGGTFFTAVSLTSPGVTNTQAKTAAGSPVAITHITFVGNTAYYTSGTDAGFGSFGTIDLSTGIVTPLMTQVTWAHGMDYDPFTGDLIVCGGITCVQIDPNSPTSIVSTFTGINGEQFDQGAVDGNGDLFWADNNGKLLFIDYANTSLIGDSSNFVSNNFYMSYLDDIAPLVGSGGTGTGNAPEPASLALVALGLSGIAAFRRRKQ